MDRMRLLIIWCTAFICICGENEVSSCEVTAKVRRGETKRVSPGQNLIVKCPVKHCGESSTVRWFKLSNMSVNWEAIPATENIKITQKYDEENLISYLSFEQVSINDDGLYKCGLGHNNDIVSHSINISVSELNKGVENPDDDAVGSDSIDDDRSSLSIFLICVAIVFLIAIAIVWVHMCFYGWKQTWTCNNKKKAEISTHMISEPSTPFSPSLQTQFSVLNDIYSSSKPGRTSASPFLALTGNVADVAAYSQASNCAVYTIINYQQCGSPARNYTCKQDEKSNSSCQRFKS